MRSLTVLLLMGVLCGPSQAGDADETADTGKSQSAPEATEQEPASPEDPCNAAQYAEYLGQPKYALSKVVFKTEMRVVAHDALVTMEFIPTRINFRLDEDGLINEIACG